MSPTVFTVEKPVVFSTGVQRLAMARIHSQGRHRGIQALRTTLVPALSPIGAAIDSLCCSGV